MSLLSSNPNGGLGPKSYASPRSCPLGGFQSINCPNICGLAELLHIPRLGLLSGVRWIAATISCVAAGIRNSAPGPVQRGLRVYHCVPSVLELYWVMRHNT